MVRQTFPSQETPSPSKSTPMPRDSHKQPTPLNYDPDFLPDSIVFATKDRVYFSVPRNPFVALEYSTGGFGYSHRLHDIEPGEEQNIIRLPEVKSDLFRLFCKVLCPRNPSTTLELSQDQWLSLLELANAWSFHFVRRAAITALTPTLTPLELIDLGKKRNVSAWLLSGYRALVTRPETLSIADSDALGHSNALLLFSIRESYVLACAAGRKELFSPDEQINAAFQYDLERVRVAEKVYTPTLDRRVREEEKLRDLQAAVAGESKGVEEFMRKPERDIDEVSQTFAIRKPVRIPSRTSSVTAVSTTHAALPMPRPPVLESRREDSSSSPEQFAGSSSNESDHSPMEPSSSPEQSFVSPSGADDVEPETTTEPIASQSNDSETVLPTELRQNESALLPLSISTLGQRVDSFPPSPAYPAHTMLVINGPISYPLLGMLIPFAFLFFFPVFFSALLS
ncbi:hypothetical protein DFP72DRAFT_608114 [Ephemerocybe angulata]|uniref:BTB domain-containing protein n=1 Tax=Ephemerocybe angulata TaxID=980116 RepID=A0A8H6HJ40_9AGAR|nr:hypothetical protein DFP72DRAFT_608114 [Tulosesus angulatus]